MHWFDNVVEQLAECPIGGYAPGGPESSEPTALAGLALSACGRSKPAQRAAKWLADLQQPDGSVGVRPGHTTPNWPTALGVLIWHALKRNASTENAGFQPAIRRACGWILSTHGKVLPPEANKIYGHDVQLVGWPWVEGTHSWLEPTALHVLALKASGDHQHPRTREAVRLLLDRLLPSGGCNYGNTFVLGNQLEPHVQPTALVLLALHGEADPHNRVRRSITFLEQAVTQTRSTASLCWAMIALTAYGHRPPNADQRLRSARERAERRGMSTHHLALLALAGLPADAQIFVKLPETQA